MTAPNWANRAMWTGDNLKGSGTQEQLIAKLKAHGIL